MKPVKIESETPAEYDRFKSLLNRLLAVPHAKIVEREDWYRFHSANNPGRPGPKPGTKRKKKQEKINSSHVPGVAPPA
jgi:hypothetical protein